MQENNKSTVQNEAQGATAVVTHHINKPHLCRVSKKLQNDTLILKSFCIL